MKDSKSITLSLVAVFLLTTACSTNKKLTAPASLYKTPEGKEIAFKSYDRSMELWNVAYSEAYVNTDYGQSHVIISGENNKQTLVILPGLFGDASMWFPNVGKLSEHYKVYTLDMINYGGKSQPEGKAITEFNDYKIWFNQILNHFKLESVAVMGVSYSSWLSLSLAREMPDAITSVIMLDPSETFMPMNGGIAWKGFKSFMFFPNRKKYAGFLSWLGGGYSNEQMDIWTEHMLDVIEYGTTKMFDVPQHRIYAPEELTMIEMPVLIMAGGKPILYDDPEVFKSNAQNALPHAEIIIVPGAGHGLNMEKPEYVNNRIIEFLGTEKI
ncbi:alpha/beta fold hydrolase [Saccharicrinis sp. FJH62]|uniref:alpha/beta fold hydrolase n=1 Tax=Saccharicrinis sp. FJH62 TaxID=3344657 RepID=UPI0035D45B8C